MARLVFVQLQGCCSYDCKFNTRMIARLMLVQLQEGQIWNALSKSRKAEKRNSIERNRSVVRQDRQVKFTH